MAYNCIVLVKQVPDTAHISGKAMKDDGTVNRAALPAIFNPEDLNALEMALQVKDRYGGQVTVLTMGPACAADVFKGCALPRRRSGDPALRSEVCRIGHLGHFLCPQMRR